MRRSFVAAIALVAVLVCLAGFWGLRRYHQPPPRPSAGEATIEFLDVGQGDAIFIRSPEGKTALVNAGPSRRIVRLLRERDVRSLDLVVVTHHHIDHYGGMDEIIRAFQPRMFLDADSPHVTPNYVALLRLVEREGITSIRAGPKSRTIELGSVRLTVFPRAPSDRDDENNNSIGIRVDFGRFSALLTGDSERAERRWWMKNARDLCAGVDVLKLAHHGSKDGTDTVWLRLTRPRLAVASMGRGNEFGHPHPETLALLRSLDIPLRRTDESGSIAIRTNGETWSVVTTAATTRGPPPLAEQRDRPSKRSAAIGPISLNTATERDLRTLPGIGPRLAGRIIEGRPYRSVNDLEKVPAVGKRRIEQIRPYLTVD